MKGSTDMAKRLVLGTTLALCLVSGSSVGAAHASPIVRPAHTPWLGVRTERTNNSIKMLRRLPEKLPATCGTGLRVVP